MGHNIETEILALKVCDLLGVDPLALHDSVWDKLLHVLEHGSIPETPLLPIPDNLRF